MRQYSSRQTIECPICGNELSVNVNAKKQKCQWCGHKMIIERKGSGNKIYLDVHEFIYQK